VFFFVDKILYSHGNGGDHFVVENIQKSHRLVTVFFEPEKNRLIMHRALTKGLINCVCGRILRDLTDSTDKCIASKSRHN